MATTQAFTNFDEVIANSELPTLVDFYAPWCGPCQLMAKILQEVNSELKSQLRIVKINTDKYPAIASRYRVYALPTLILFKDGQPVDRIEGAMPTHQLVEHLRSHL
jgi:thioredoxin